MYAIFKNKIYEIEVVRQAELKFVYCNIKGTTVLRILHKTSVYSTLELATRAYNRKFHIHKKKPVTIKRVSKTFPYQEVVFKIMKEFKIDIRKLSDSTDAQEAWYYYNNLKNTKEANSNMLESYLKKKYKMELDDVLMFDPLTIPEDIEKYPQSTNYYSVKNLIDICRMRHMEKEVLDPIRMLHLSKDGVITYLTNILVKLEIDGKIEKIV